MLHSTGSLIAMTTTGGMAISDGELTSEAKVLCIKDFFGPYLVNAACDVGRSRRISIG